MKRIISFFTLFAIYCGSNAQSAIFWKISKSGTQDTTYLYGSMHIQDKRVFSLDPQVEQAFEQSPNFILEMELDKLDPIKMGGYMAMSKGYEELLTPGDFKMFKSYFESNEVGINFEMANQIKPFFLYSLCLSLITPNEMSTPLDLDFLVKARKANKNVIGLESLEDQMYAIDQISLRDQAQMLMEIIINPESTKKEFDKMLDLYLKGDSEGLWELSSDLNNKVVGSEGYIKNFLIDRNIKMVNGIKNAMGKGNSFVLVGAAHLGGEYGIVKLLQTQGYEAVPMTVKF